VYDTLIQGGAIIGNITDITKDLKTGFGTFVEKNLAPFTSTNEDYNCPADHRDECRAPYSFFHRFSLDVLGAKEFENSVKAPPLAGNVDEPEGGLDALMQVSNLQSFSDPAISSDSDSD
jgi:hypothetical protein